jgi:hypothetical protein
MGFDMTAAVKPCGLQPWWMAFQQLILPDEYQVNDRYANIFLAYR